MSRFEKKCFVGSAALHGLLLVVVLFGAAFLPSKKPEILPPVITIFPAKVTDRLIASGGNPNANPTPPPPPPEPPPVKPEPPKPEPPKIRQPDVKPVVKDPKPEKKDAPKEITPIKPINTTVTRRTNNAALQRAAAERAAKELADRKYREEVARYNAERSRIADQVNGIAGGVGKSLSKSTVVEAFGPGGVAYANYGSLVGEIYKRAVYASHPQSDEDVDAVIRVVVARDGSVRSSQWVRRTGNSVLDRAVDNAMNKTRSLPEFPPETKDPERTFTITLAFEAKKISA